MIRRPPRSTLSSSSAASDVYKRQQKCPGIFKYLKSGNKILRQIYLYNLSILNLTGISNSNYTACSNYPVLAFFKNGFYHFKNGNFFKNTININTSKVFFAANVYPAFNESAFPPFSLSITSS